MTINAFPISRLDETEKILHTVIPAEAGHEMKHQRYPELIEITGCWIRSSMTQKEFSYFIRNHQTSKQNIFALGSLCARFG